jgi:C-terminal four TMM region of protein-O-mannosyltransferase
MKVSPSGARAVTSDSYMCRPRCHYGLIVSNFPTGHSDSKRSTEIKNPWTAALLGMLTRLFLQEVRPCSFIVYVYLLSRSPEQVKTPKPLGFFRKFFELQLMMQHNAGLTASHPYTSARINWPFLLTGSSFWMQNEGQKQINHIGNIVGWWACALALSLFVGIIGADLLAKRRGIHPIPIGK